MVLLFGYRQYQLFTLDNKQVYIDKEFRQQAEDFIAQLEAKEFMQSNSESYSDLKKEAAESFVPHLFLFDPNSIQENDLKELGLSDYVVRNIIAYREHGGLFKEPSDLSKIYGMSPEEFKRLQEFIIIDTTIFNSGVERQEFQFGKNKEELELHIDLNRADKYELMKIRGIGPSFAERIIRYRENLGGYYKLDQLLEVYGLDTVKFKEINNHLYISDTILSPLYVNLKNASELIQHPYIESWSVANAIENYRKQHGKYQSLNDIRKVHLLNDTLLDKLKPYLSFDQ